MRYLSASKPVCVLTLLRSIYKRAQTGTLELETDEGLKRLYFVEGQLHLSKSASPLAERIDQVLKGLTTWEASRADGKMVQLLGMTREHLSSWKVKSYRFAEGFRVDVEDLVGPLSTAVVVGDPADPQEDDDHGFLQLVDQPNTVLVARDLDTAQLKSSDLSRQEMDMLFRLVQPVGAAELLPAAGSSSANTLSTLSRLWKLGLIECSSEPAELQSEPFMEEGIPPGENQVTAVDYDADKAQSQDSPETLSGGSAVREPLAEFTVGPGQLDSAGEPGVFLSEPLETSNLAQEVSREWYRFFGLTREPFSLTPDPTFLFLGEDHAEALAGLKLSLLESRGLCTLIGEVGTGKTMLLYSLLSTLDRNIKTAYINNPALPFDQLLENVLNDLGIVFSSTRRVDLLNCLNRFLVDSTKSGKTVALVIDEAQNLTDTTFEALRLLLNYETFDAKLLQIILVGQPELGERLRSSRLRQIADRIAIQCRLSPLSRADSRRYISHRLAAAGGELDIFSRGALGFVVKRCSGNPRRINVLCHNAMLFAYAEGLRTITRRTVVEAERDFRR